MRKFLMYLTSFFMIGTIFTVSVLAIVDNYLYNISNSTVHVSASNTYARSTKLTGEKNEQIKLEEGVKDLDISFDNKYYIYLKDSKVYINEVKTNKNIRVISSKQPITYAKLLYDKNRIMYFTAEKKSTGTKLSLYSHEISSGVTTDFNTLTVTDFDEIIEIYSSPVINILYLDIATKTSSNVQNRVMYRIDLFNSLSVYSRGVKIKSGYMLQWKDRLYYEDEKGNIYVSGNRINLFKENVNLIGIDDEDNVYFLNYSKNKVYKVFNGVIKQTITLEDSNVINTHCNHKEVHIIYKDYVIDVSSTEPTKKIAKLTEFVDFVAIKNNSIYLRLGLDKMVRTNTTLLTEE